ncbi:MAG: hypothetical protein H6744_18725 [Deltaproteobacteria bacterium]|nr:hypothetical protein [Deltaproteobacteria bacterium]
MRGRSRASIVGVLLALACQGGCASTLPRPGSPPAPPQLELRALAPVTHELASGLTVVESPSRDGTFSAALLFGGGPLDDPADMPGLTELAVQAALLGTDHDPDDARPASRALAVGGELHSVADGRVFGWLVRGPAASAAPLLGLLLDLASVPSLPASRFDILVAKTREQVREEGLGSTGTGIAVAAGTALGLGRALPLAPTEAMLERVHREDVLRHWRRVARPERGALVLRMPAGHAVPADADAAYAGWQVPGPAMEEVEPCLPLGQTLHRIASPDAARTRSVALVAAAAPGLGDPERDAVESLQTWLSRRPDGPIERVVGPEEAFRSHPWLLDLGWGGGAGVSVLLTAVGGENAEVAVRLRGITDLLAAQAAGEVLTDEEAAAAHRALVGQERLQTQTPLLGMLLLGVRALYHPVAKAPAPEAIHQMAARWLAPHRLTLVVDGFADLSLDEDEHAHETVWDTGGERVSGPAPARCVPLPVVRDQKPVDSVTPRR